MKYPLAVINRLMDVYGSDLLVGYDIACAFARTVAKSSLSQRVTDMRLNGIVPAFHGHGHNRGCQVYWHPRYFEGTGKEDFKGCERLFSASNHLASGTRLASVFHRRQAIEEFLQQWSRSKHEESGASIPSLLNRKRCDVRSRREFHLQQLQAGALHNPGRHGSTQYSLCEARRHNR